MSDPPLLIALLLVDDATPIAFHVPAEFMRIATMRQQSATPTMATTVDNRRDKQTSGSMSKFSNIIVACMIVGSFLAYFYFSYGFKNYSSFFIESFEKVTQIGRG